MAKFVPSKKMSGVFSDLAKKFKEEESRVALIPIGTPEGEQVPTEPAKAEIEEGVESDEEGQSQEKRETDEKKEREVQKSVMEESIGKAVEVLDVEGVESRDSGETLS